MTDFQGVFGKHGQLEHPVWFAGVTNRRQREGLSSRSTRAGLVNRGQYYRTNRSPKKAGA
jgi:hypothetical protein